MSAHTPGPWFWSQGVDDWAIVLTFQLKAFPRFRLGQDTDQVDRLFGG